MTIRKLKSLTKSLVEAGIARKLTQTQRLKLRFALVSVFGMSVLLTLGVMGILAVNYTLKQQKNLKSFHEIITSQMGNVQKLSMIAEELKSDLDTAQRHALFIRFKHSYAELKGTQDRLQAWLVENRTRASSSPADRLIIASGLEQQVRSYLETAEEIKETGPNSSNALRAQAERMTHGARTELIDILNNVLISIVEEENSKSDILRMTNFAIIVIILLTAVSLWAFVFNPMFKTILSQQDGMFQAVFRAEEASRAKTEFLANVSHEIRTPMTAILGYTELLEAQSETKPEVRQAFQIIRANADHLMRLIDDILDVSKIEAGGVKLSFERVNLRQLLLEVQSLLKVKADEKNIFLRFLVESALPEYFQSDAVRLKQILFNIVGNAIKFTEEGGVRVVVRYDPKRTLGALQFLVKDTGSGIPAEQMSRLFRPFTQVDTTTQRAHGGTGLGLVLSKRLSVMLQGDVEILESIPGKGTTFLVSVQPQSVGPLVNNMDLSQPTPVRKSDGDSTDALVNNRLEGTKILVVDDAIENCNLFRIYLEKAKAKVDVAYNGEEALKKAQAAPYDLIFLDLQMPGRDGFEVLRELRENHYTKPIVALTAHAMPEERMRTLNFGFDDHVSKPVSAEKLVSTVTKFI